MHAYLHCLKYKPSFFHNPFLAWLVRFAISDPTHLGHLTSNPLELTYKSFFRVFIILHGLAFIVLVATHLLTGNSMSCWLIWGDHSLLRCLTTKKIQCHLLSWKIQTTSCKQRCPIVSLPEAFSFHCFLEWIKSPSKYNVSPLFWPLPLNAFC